MTRSEVFESLRAVLTQTGQRAVAKLLLKRGPRSADDPLDTTRRLQPLSSASHQQRLA